MYSANGKYVVPELKEHYDTALDAEKAITKEAMANPSTIEYVIVPTYWYAK